jgi:hypothetical protein
MISYDYIKYIHILINTWEARHQWLVSVTLATQEAEIRRIIVQRQPSAYSSWDPILKTLITKQQSWQSGSNGRAPA